MEIKKILLIGGTGFIGSNLTHALLDKGNEVAILCRNLPEHQIPSVTYLSNSPNSTSALESILPECSHVFYLASATTPGTAIREPSVEVLNNLLPISHFLETLQKYPNIKLIFISSGGAIYGNSMQDYVIEETTPHPLSYYGAGKVAIEAFLYAFQKQSGIQVTVLRPSNLYGKGQTLKANFGIIPTILNCQVNAQIFRIWGDGETIRDYLYIDDFIDLCLRIIRSTSTKNAYNVYNAGSGQGLSVNQLCRLIEAITEHPVKREYLEARNVDVKRIVLDSNSVKSTYNWLPSTSIETGLKKIWDGYRCSKA